MDSPDVSVVPRVAGTSCALVFDNTYSRRTPDKTSYPPATIRKLRLLFAGDRYLAKSCVKWHDPVVTKEYFCPASGLVAVRRSVEFHLTDWFNE